MTIHHHWARVGWLKQLPITKNKNSLDKETDQSKHVYRKYYKRFTTNHTFKSTEVKVGIPYHKQDDVKNELNRIIKHSYLEILETIEENCFVSPVVITVKKNESVKVALDIQKLRTKAV